MINSTYLKLILICCVTTYLLHSLLGYSWLQSSLISVIIFYTIGIIISVFMRFYARLDLEKSTLKTYEQASKNYILAECPVCKKTSNIYLDFSDEIYYKCEQCNNDNHVLVNIEVVSATIPKTIEDLNDTLKSKLIDLDK